MAVGIFDSGLGGLTVLSAVEARLPDIVAGREAAAAPKAAKADEAALFEQFRSGSAPMLKAAE